MFHQFSTKAGISNSQIKAKPMGGWVKIWYLDFR